MIELNKIYNEDCLIGMQKIPDHSVDCIICDLPYGTTRNAWDSVIPLDQLWEQYNRVIKKGGVIALFCQQPFTTTVASSNLSMLKYEWIWEKEQGTGGLNCKYQPLKVHENVLVFYETPSMYNPQMSNGKPYTKKRQPNNSTNYGETRGGVFVNEGVRYPTSIIRFNHDTDTFHPTQKPLDLIRYLVLTYSNEGDTILDNCMGSGTTAIACIKEKRNFIGFELNKEYYDKANARILNEQRQLSLF